MLISFDGSERPTTRRHQHRSSQAGAVTVSGLSSAEWVVTAQEIGALLTGQVTVAVPPQRTYEGPLLWTLVDNAGVVEANKLREHVREVVIATGSDG